MAETWYFNETIDVSQDRTFNVNYHANGVYIAEGVFLDLMFISIRDAKTSTGATKELYYGYYPVPGKTTTVSFPVYNDNVGWGDVDVPVRTIILDEPATGDLLTWLEANAVKQGGGWKYA